ncbi:hypothetical protein [Aldersonia kunmingensis]|uniref:hypothetical protein n=1 Tax=Aldersonia kunmingensis TaxID=408066 RepID=UPI00082F02AC|nr:hypothetical protein [Aldersonia kunmingensis]
MYASARKTARRAGIAVTTTAAVVLGTAAGVAGIAGLEAATVTTSVTVPVVAAGSPEGQPGHNEICAALRARHDNAMRLHPSDAAQARIASQSMLDMNC